jgi:hypothetical protein
LFKPHEICKCLAPIGHRDGGQAAIPEDLLIDLHTQDLEGIAGLTLLLVSSSPVPWGFIRFVYILKRLLLLDFSI